VLALPTHYIAGLNVLTRSIAAGFDPVVVEGGHFTVAGFVRATDRLTEPARFVSLVPAQLATLLDDADGVAALQASSRVLIGGPAMPSALRTRAQDHGIRITRTYGSSETSGGCVYDGIPIGTTSVRIDEGEVWLGGPTLAEGYLDDPELTAERFVIADGAHWFRTADTGSWDGERLTVTGRSDDVIVSGGLKVSLGQVERILQRSVPDAVVVSASDERWGEVPVAVTASRDDFAEGVAAVERELGSPARPGHLIRISPLPTLPSGKVDRVTLRGRVSKILEEPNEPRADR
jgi:O-succinylbenzoic acid--CoA ligase